MRLEKDGRVVNGQGAYTDILVSATKAYLSALSKLSNQENRIKAQGGAI